MTSSLAAVGKKGNVFFLNEIASKFRSSCDCLQFSVWTTSGPSELWGDWGPGWTVWHLMRCEVWRCGGRMWWNVLAGTCLSPPGVQWRVCECERLLSPPAAWERYNRQSCVAALAALPVQTYFSCWWRLVVAVTWSRTVLPPLRPARPSPSLVAVTAALHTATVGGELCARELNASSEDSLVCPQWSCHDWRPQPQHISTHPCQVRHHCRAVSRSSYFWVSPSLKSRMRQ